MTRYRVIIADDEPLARAGVASIIDWEAHGCTVVGVAENGSVAWDMIEELEPDIVITDIKMPLISGLELAGRVYDKGMQLPVFILLTSYEDFGFARLAVSYQVVDYLVKLELTQDTLLAALEHAAARINHLRIEDGTRAVAQSEEDDMASAHPVVNNVKAYIDEHLTEHLSLSSVAQAVGISPGYLSSLFSKYNPVGFTDYVNSRKIARAKELLHTGKYRVYEIADMLGFESQFYFSKVFKKVTGKSPRDFVKGE